MKRALVLCGLLLVAFASSPALAQFDHTHSDWNRLLSRHVVTAEDGYATRVRYRAFAKDRAALHGYLAALSRASESEFSTWSRPERLAFLINAYNAFTIEKVLSRYPDLLSIRDFGSVFGNPWKDRFFTLLGRMQNLDGIEHGMIRAPGVFDEPRIHFAVNCAATGCPALREEAYVAARLDAQLEAQTVRFLSDRSRNRIERGVLRISRIFDWYREDFSAGNRGWHATAGFVAQYARYLSDTEPERQSIRESRYAIEFLDYDWRLNDAEGEHGRQEPHR